MQPIVSDLGKISSFEVLSKVYRENNKLICSERFFEQAGTDMLKRLALEQIYYFNDFSIETNMIFSYNLPISSFLDRVFMEHVNKATKNEIAIEINDFDLDLDDFEHNDAIHIKALVVFPWDVVKVDKKYVSSSYDSSFLEKLISELGRTVDKTIVEGVENSDQAKFLSSKKISFQGYHVSRPIDQYAAKRLLEHCVSVYA